MKKLNKMLAAALALVLCMSLMPLGAFAADSDCSTCGGTGKVKTSTVCSMCKGKGSCTEFDWTIGGPVTKKCEDCNGAGYLLEDCPDCDGINPDDCAHEWVKVVLALEPTCTTKGRYDKVCMDCGTVLEQHVGRDPVPLSHKYEPTVVKEATCTNEGLTAQMCSCGARKNVPNEPIPALGHDLVRESVDSETGDVTYKCSRCDHKETGACKHEDTSTINEPSTCVLPGYDVTTCNDCGQVISKKQTETVKDHSWDNGVMYGGVQKITYTCTVCHAKRIEHNTIPEKPYDREIEICMGFQTTDGVSFGTGDIPKDFSVTYSYEWNGETITVTLPVEDADITSRPMVYQDENGTWVFDDDTQEKYSTASWKIRVPVDPTTGEPMKGTILNITESGHDKIDGYEWDHAFGYNPAHSTDGTGILYVPSNGSTVTWVYNVYAKTASYTINYYYGGVLGSTSEGTARVGSTITVSTGSASYNGETYVFSSVSGDTTIGVGGNVINVYYTLPAPETDPGDPTDPTVEIDEPEVPLAGAIGLNDVDHMAYIIGYEDDTVRPLGNITRAEVSTIFFRLMTDLYRTINWSTTNDFSDVNEGDWFNNAVSTCANAGIVDGYADGTFLPNKAVTRAEFAAIVARFLGDEYTGEGIEDFSDTADHWAAEDIRRCVEAGWVTTEEDAFRPDDLITRAEVMTIINRMLHRTPDEDHMLPTMKTWTDNPKGTDYYEAIQEATNEHEYELDEAGIETWTALLEMRDWAALEAQWAAEMGEAA